VLLNNELRWGFYGMVHGAWCRVQGAGCRVQGAGCRVPQCTYSTREVIKKAMALSTLVTEEGNQRRGEIKEYIITNLRITSRDTLIYALS
jgi:hypothetical protein